MELKTAKLRHWVSKTSDKRLRTFLHLDVNVATVVALSVGAASFAPIMQGGKTELLVKISTIVSLVR
jgi:hypothetical protein